MRARLASDSPVSPLYLPCISPIPPLYLPRLGQPVLAYLMDVKTSSQLGGGKQGFQLAFVFAENPYFTDKVLTKAYPNPNPNPNPNPTLTLTLTVP